MAIITDYATLQTAVADYLAVDNLTSFIPNFIQNAEGKIYRSLRFSGNETALSVTISGGTATVPTDYLELKYANVVASSYISLERVTPERIYAEWPVRSGSSPPSAISRSGSTFIFGPYPGDYTITGIYYKRLPSLSVSNTTNWFTSYAPEVLLYAALLEAQTFVLNDKRIPTWQSMLQQAMQTVVDSENSESQSGSSIATRVG